jgi:ribosomal protein S18 acetylase RimI-like enzyme
VRFWELGELQTNVRYQRRGLGSSLVDEGMRSVERRAREGGGEGWGGEGGRCIFGG